MRKVKFPIILPSIAGVPSYLTKKVLRRRILIPESCIFTRHEDPHRFHLTLAQHEVVLS